VRGKFCFEGDDGVGETGLVGESDGGRGIERRTGGYAAESCEAGDGCGKRGIGRAGVAGQVRTHPDVGRLHVVRVNRRKESR
jgi:hypothetical protein